MTNAPEWLPDLIRLADFDNDWEAFEKCLYGHFERDFIHDPPKVRGMEFKLKRYPLILGRSATFWHLLSEGKVEDSRQVDLERCARICWPRKILERLMDPNHDLKVWREKRHGDERIHIALPDFSYIVVLAQRDTYVLLWTAFCVDRHQRRQGYTRAWDRYQKTKSQKA